MVFFRSVQGQTVAAITVAVAGLALLGGCIYLWITKQPVPAQMLAVLTLFIGIVVPSPLGGNVALPSNTQITTPPAPQSTGSGLAGAPAPPVPAGGIAPTPIRDSLAPTPLRGPSQ